MMKKLDFSLPEAEKLEHPCPRCGYYWIEKGRIIESKRRITYAVSKIPVLGIMITYPFGKVGYGCGFCGSYFLNGKWEMTEFIE